MLNITEKNHEDLITLKHGVNVFHDALIKVKEGETRFHVTDETGSVPDYDLVYTANMLLFPEQVRALILKMTNGGSTYAPFLAYNEADEENLCLDFLKQFNRIELLGADEYSIVFARLALKYTDYPIYFTDDRFTWFIEDSDRMHKVDSHPEEHDKTTLRVTNSPFDMGYTKRDFSTLSSVAAFQNLFVWQAFTSGKEGPFKYTELVLTQIAGIGGILSGISMVGRASAGRGFKTFLQPGCTRYPEDLLCRYFHIDPKPDDATEENTITIKDLAVFTTSWYCCQFPANFDESILDDKFAEEMNEYAQAVIGDSKCLGVLARGTDYVTNNLGDDRVHARPAHMIPEIKKWMQENDYKTIFLATEDKDIYDAFLKEFPGKVRVIAQERHSVSEMKEKDATLIYEFEKKLNSGKAYEDALEDTTVNYFYALYILSKCDAFMCSGQCNGWDVVRSFNKGKFEKEYKFTVGIDKASSGRAVGGAILSGKSFMYTEDSYHAIGIRLVFKEKVDPKCLQKAVDQAIVANPWSVYGIFEEDGSFFYHTKLTKIIQVKESGWEDMPNIGGKDAEGHLLSVFCKGCEVIVAAFHGLTDGKGLMDFSEEMLRGYVAYAAGNSYNPKPNDSKDLNAEPFEVASEAADKMKLPKMPAGKGDFIDKAPFLIQKGFEGEDIKPSHYLIKADAAEYMKLAKNCKVRPAALLAAAYGKAVVRVMGNTQVKSKVAIPVDFREALDIPGTFRNCAMPPVIIDIEPEILNGELGDVALKVQDILTQRTSKAAGVMAVKAMADMFSQMPKLPYKQAAGLFAGFSNGPVFTYNASYVKRIEENEYTGLIDGIYPLYPSTGSQTVLEMIALPDHFCISMNQGGETQQYADAFCDILSENGVTCNIAETLHGNPGYIELRESEGWK